MLFFTAIVFLIILCIALITLGYFLGKSNGLMQGRKDLADYVLSGGEQ